MARLQKFSGTQALPGVGSPQVVADTAVGAVTAKLGSQIARSVADLGELTAAALKHEAKEKKKADRAKHAARAEDLTKRKNAFAGKKAAEALELDVRNKLDEPWSETSEPPVPLADEMVTFMRMNGDKLWNELPEQQRPSFGAAIKLGEDQLRTDIAVAENSQDEAYFRDGMQQTKDLAVETVSRRPDRIDQVFEHYLDIADTAVLSRRQKERSIHDAGRELVEAWVQAHPPETQIAELSKLQALTLSEANSDPNRANARGSGNEEQTEFAMRASVLPVASRNRLLTTALKKRTETTLVEQARIAERIENAHELVDPQEIRGNVLLGNQARLQLLNQLREAVETRARNVSALERLADTGKSIPSLTDAQELVSNAISYLSDGKTDPATLARGIAINTGFLPANAGKTLVKNLGSENSEDVAKAFTTLSVLKHDGEKGGPDGAEAAQIRNLQAGETYLTTEQGLSTEAARALFAKANQVKTRKERLENFAALYPGKRRSQTTAYPALG